MNEVLHLLSVVGPLVGIGGIVTVATQVFKRIASLENSKYIKFLFHCVTVATTFVSYLLGNHGLSAFAVVLHGGSYGYFGNLLYPIVKKADSFLQKFAATFKALGRDVPEVKKDLDEAEQALGVATPETPTTPTFSA